jgi:hypothetical protein
MQTARTLEAEWRKVLRGNMSTGTKKDESSTGCVWAAGLHQVMASSHWAGILKLTNHLVYFFNFQIFFQAAVYHGYWISEYGAHFCVCVYINWVVLILVPVPSTALSSCHVVCSYLPPCIHHIIKVAAIIKLLEICNVLLKICHITLSTTTLATQLLLELS